MIKFDEQKQLDSVAGALAIRKEIEGIAADVAGRGYKNICYLGIGGTYASALQTQNHVQEYSGMEIIAQNATSEISHCPRDWRISAYFCHAIRLGISEIITRKPMLVFSRWNP